MVLVCLVITAYGYLSYKYFKSEFFVFLCVIFASVWTSVYRLCADLHRSLLSYLFFLLLVIIMMDVSESGWGRRRSIVIILLVLLMSFTLIHMVMFALYILFVYIVLRFVKEASIRRVLYDILVLAVLGLATLPALYLYFLGPKFKEDVGMALRGDGQAGVSMGLMDVLSALTSLTLYGGGFSLLPFALLGLCFLFWKFLRKGGSQRDLIVMAWVIGILVMIPFQVMGHMIRMYVDRALMFFPAPLLSAYGLYVVLSFAYGIIRERGKSVFWRRRHVWKLLGVLFIGFVVWVSFATTFQEASIHLKAFVPSTLHEKLVWLKEHYAFKETPIFVFYPYPRFTGSHVTYYNNYIGAVFGKHYIFLGTLTDLMRLVWTPFYRSIRGWQQYYGSFMVNDGVFCIEGLRSHPIIVIDDLYIQILHEDNYLERSLIIEVRDGIYLVNSSKISFNCIPEVVLFPVNVFSITGNYVFGDNYAYLLLYCDHSEGVEKMASVAFIVYLDGPREYIMIMKYLDANATFVPFVIKINGSQVGEIKYNGTQMVVEREFRLRIGVSGYYLLVLSLADPSIRYYLKLYSIRILPSS